MYKYLIVLFCLVAYSVTLFSVEIEENEKKQVELLASTLESFESKEVEKIWPRFDLKTIPTIIHFKNEHIYAFGWNSNDKWDKHPIHGQTAHFSSKDHWGLTKVMMHPGFMVEGQKAFIFGLNTEIKDTSIPIITFVHERFHLHQFAHFNREDEKRSGYSKEWDEQNQIYIGMENHLLTQFLQTKDNEFLKDFLAINQTRQSLLDPASAAWEDIQQRMEGLADYVSLKTFEVFPLLKSFSAEAAVLKLRQGKTGSHYSLVNDAIKGRHYFVGSVLGFALDHCQADWKLQAEKGMALRQLLARALPLSDQNIQERVKKIKNSAEYDRISQTIQSKLSEEKREIDAIVQAFDSHEGVCVHLGRPMQSFSGGGKNQKSIHVGKGQTALTHDTSFASSKDSRWKLRFKDIPIIFENGNGGKIFKVEEKTIFEINNKEMSLQELVGQTQSIQFTSLKFQDQHCEFSSDLNGSVQFIQGKVFIKFN